RRLRGSLDARPRLRNRRPRPRARHGRRAQSARMLMYPQFNPVALQLRPVAIHWYGLTYLAAFGLFFFLATRRLRHEPFRSVAGEGAWSRKDVEDMLFLGVMGVIVRSEEHTSELQ